MANTWIRNTIMRCVSCDETLSDYEATRKDLHLEFVSLCNECLAGSEMNDIYLLDRPDLKHDSDDVLSDEGLPYLDDFTTQPGGSDDL